MAGKGPNKSHSKDGHQSKEGSHRAPSPDLPSSAGPARPLMNKFDSDFLPSAMGPPHGMPTPPMILEQKLATQHAEIQRLLTDNQRLAVTHVALRQELVAAQREIVRMRQNRMGVDNEMEQRLTITQVALRQELADAKQDVHRLQEALTAVRAEKDQHMRGTVDKVAQLEAELKATEPMKNEFEKLRLEREELVARMEHLTMEVRKLPLKDQEIASLKNEVDELRQRFQQARMDFEVQKKLNFERLEQTQAMEKNCFTMAREIEKLRAELAITDRRAHAAMLASSGAATPAALQNSAPSVGAYGNNYGSQQDAAKGGHNRSENNPGMEGSKYGAGMEGYQSKMQTPEDRLPKATPGSDPSTEWTKHSAPNGKTFYYNAVTGATQWDKPSTAGDAQAMHQSQLQHTHGQAVSPELAMVQQQHPPVPMQQQQPPLQPHVSAPAYPQQANYGINLLVFGISEGISDRDLASFFLPYGRVLYAKVMVDNKPGAVQFYGLVTMENLPAAEAAVAAVNGMLILGRPIKVEIQPREQVPHPSYPQQSMQQNMMQGGLPPGWQQHGGPAGGWPR